MTGTSRGNAARVAAAVGLGLMTMAQQVAPALAANSTAATPVTYGENGTLTINNVKDNATSFKAYQIFKANKNADGTASNVTWASDAVKAKVLGVLDGLDGSAYQTWLTAGGHTDTDAHDQAEYAAQYIASVYSDGAKLDSGYTAADQAAGTGKVVDYAELLNKVAAAVDDVEASTPIQAGTATKLGEGYWVAVTDGTSVGTNEDGTSPIFALIGASDNVTVTEKTGLPTVTKTVRNDKAGSDYGTVADSQFGQDIDYRLEGTVASNYHSYGEYQYKFTDTLAPGLTINQSSVKVTIDGNDVTQAVKALQGKGVSFAEGGDATQGQTLTVDLGDLKTLSGVTVKDDSHIVVDYKAQLDPAKAANVTYGGAGNANTVTVTYSSNPNTSETATTNPSTVHDHAFKLRIDKVDRDTGEDLSGAKFTIQATGADEGAQTTYVQADGSLGATAHEFETDKDGLLAVSGLDAGTYTVHETQAPTSFQTTADFTFTITPAYKADGSVDSVTVDTAGNADVKDGIHEGPGLLETGDTPVYDAGKGEIALTVGDVRNTLIPVTGAEGIGIAVVAGTAIVVLSFAGIMRRRHEDEDDGVA